MASKKRKYENDQTYQISTEWIIKKEEINKLDESQTVCDTKRSVPGMDSIKFYLKFYPNWLKKCRLYLYLEMEESVNLIVNARVICESANFTDYWTHIYKKTDSYGLPVCLSNELFDKEKKFIVENQISILFEATLTTFDVKDFPSKKIKIESFLGPKLWENESGKDGKIVVDGNEIKVHKSALQSRSTMFKAVCKIEPGVPLLSSKVFPDTVTIKNYGFKIVEKAVMFCYDRPCFDNLTAEDAINLLKFSEEFQMKDLKKYMEEICIKNLSISNACIFANSSIATKAEKLYQKCFEFLLKCMKDGTAVKEIEKLNDSMQKELFVRAFSTS